MHIVPISDPGDPRLRDYTGLTDVALRRLSEPEDGHEAVVVLLGRGEIRNADADVVDESGPGQRSPPSVPRIA